MPKNVTSFGKLLLQKGNLLKIPDDIREALHIEKGDSLEMRLEGNLIILEPKKWAPSAHISNRNMDLGLGLPEEQRNKEANSGREYKFPLRLVCPDD